MRQPLGKHRPGAQVMEGYDQFEKAKYWYWQKFRGASWETLKKITLGDNANLGFLIEFYIVVQWGRYNGKIVQFDFFLKRLGT